MHLLVGYTCIYFEGCFLVLLSYSHLGNDETLTSFNQELSNSSNVKSFFCPPRRWWPFKLFVHLRHLCDWSRTFELRNILLTFIINSKLKKKPFYSKFQVRWYKNSMLLEPTDTIRMTSRANRHTLILSSIRSGMDFGNYSCVAENSLGTFK